MCSSLSELISQEEKIFRAFEGFFSSNIVGAVYVAFYMAEHYFNAGAAWVSFRVARCFG